jgi:tryptophan 2,3-dioxygenase
VYELWFKQMLHELGHVQRQLEDGETAGSLHTLRRTLTILKVVVAQIDVLETMTPRQFAGFRNRLDAASGFQSRQFRELEALLGRRDPSVLGAYPLASTDRARIADAMARRSLFDSFLLYLSGHGFAVPRRLLERDVTAPITREPELDDVLLAVYGDDRGPAQVTERLIDLDEGLQEWRYRHVKMVERTIGDKAGTGGSSGSTYLRSTLFTPMFPDLWAVRSRL